MQFSSGGTLRVRGVGAFCAVLAISGYARAEQFVVADETYTHKKETTSDSHYRVSPTAATPKDWTKPTDWTKGSAHVLLEVKTKPTETPTKFQICFEGTPSYACTDQSPTYTKPGKYEWTTNVKSFWSPEGKPMQWANGVTKVALILKDTNNGKPQGDPNYVPTDVHIEVAIVSEGSKYQPPGAAPADAGSADAGAVSKDAGTVSKDAGATDAGADADDAGEQADEPDASPSPSRPDASSPVVRDSGTARADAARPGEEPTDSSEPATASSADSGCTLGGSGSASGWLAMLALSFVRRRRA